MHHGGHGGFLSLYSERFGLRSESEYIIYINYIMIYSELAPKLPRTATDRTADAGLGHSLVLPPAPFPTRPAPDLADRLDLTFNVDEDGPVTVPLQPLVNERPQHHLKAHRTLEFARRLSGEAPSPVQDPLGNHEKDLGLILEHRYLRVLPAGSVASTISGSVVECVRI
jgi:hypothetical protein